MRRSLALLLCGALLAGSVPAEAGPLPRAAAVSSRVFAAPVGPVAAVVGNAALAPARLALAAPAFAAPANESAPVVVALRPPPAATAFRPVEGALTALPPSAPGRFEAANDRDGGAAPAVETARALAAPGAAARSSGPVFDGARRLAAASDAPRAGPDAPRGPRLERPSLARRLFKRPVPTATMAAQSAAAWTALTGAYFLALWGVIPAMQIPYSVIASGLLAVGAIAALDAAKGLYRLGRRLAGRPAPPPVAAPRAKRAAAYLAGVVLGLGLVAAPLVYERPIVQTFHAILDSRRDVSEREDVRAVRGEALSQETVRVLSANPVGRRILEGLRDRGGVLRMPTFYVSKQDGSVAAHTGLLDAVYLGEDEITAMGWSVEGFLNDPALQREFVLKNQSTLAHELTHAVQARRSPFAMDYFRPAMEHEYEAFVNELFYNHERLKADPSAELGADMVPYLESLADLGAFLRGLDGLGSYDDNVHVDTEFWRAWRADLLARWPAHRVEAYRLLAQREHEAGHDRAARSYWDRARDAALSAGLPLPPELPKR